MIYLDANIVIRLIEGVDAARLPVKARLSNAFGQPMSMMTSELTWLESRVLPMRNSDANTLRQFDVFLNGVEVWMIPVSKSILEKATEIRATLGFKTPDAIHYATAILGGASVFLTGDKQFTKATEVPVEIL